MDCSFNWQYKTLINELTRGIEHAKQLKAYLSSVASTSENQELLLQKILASYEQSLVILKRTGSTVHSSKPLPPTCGAIESSVSVDGSPKSDDKKRCFKEHQALIDISKKRKSQLTWTEQVKVSAESGVEGPTDDGYSWRKYGQKHILGAKYPRKRSSMFQCQVYICFAEGIQMYISSHAKLLGNKTSAKVRQNDATKITNRDSHNCRQATNRASLEKQELKKQAVYQTGQQYSNQVLTNSRANLRVDTDDLDKNETACPFSFPPTFSGLTDKNRHFQISDVDDNLLGSGYSPAFVSPTTPESNYFSVSSSCQMNAFGVVRSLHHSKSDLTDIFSANTSATSSPIMADFHSTIWS